MSTATAIPGFIHSIAPGLTPAEVAGVVIAKPDELLCAALDLQRLSLSASQAAEWISEFHRIYLNLGPQYGLKGLPPSVAVFADHFTQEDEALLRSVDAVLFDRSLLANEDCQTSEQLMEKLAESILAMTPRASKRPLVVDVDPDLSILNSFPIGMTPSDANDFLCKVNEG